MARPAADPHLSYAEYLQLERDSGLRHEFLAGQVWAMAGGTLRHSAINTNLTGRVLVGLDGTPCRPYDSDAKVRVAATDHATYPDLAIVCGPVERGTDDPNALTNPVVLFEVLSPGTEAWDRGGKFVSYQSLPSLQHYVLLSEDRVQVEHYRRSTPDAWTYRRLAPGDRLRLELPDGVLELSIDALYRDLPPAAES